MTKEPITISAVGDAIFDRPDPCSAFQYVGPIFSEIDCAICNMEQVLGDADGNKDPRQGISHGSRFVEPYVKYNVDCCTAGTNHAMDWGPEGLIGTMEVFEKAGIPYCGIGKNLEESRKPAIIERKGNKIGILNYCSVAYEDYYATKTRPGVAPILVWTMYEDIDSAPAAPPLVHSRVREESLEMVIEDVKKLREQVDILIVAYHWGQICVPIEIPEYCYQLGRATIDAGADAVVSHHPHILKGAEMYKGKPIFYSLGNMLSDFGDNFDEVDKKMISGINALYKPTPDDFAQRALTGIVKFSCEDGRIVKTSIIPCIVNEDNDPMPVDRNDPDGLGEQIREYFSWISAGAGLNGKFTWESDTEFTMACYTPEELKKVIADYQFVGTEWDD